MRLNPTFPDPKNYYDAQDFIHEKVRNTDKIFFERNDFKKFFAGIRPQLKTQFRLTERQVSCLQDEFQDIYIIPTL